MADIVKQLRAVSEIADETDPDLVLEAAHEIEKLRALLVDIDKSGRLDHDCCCHTTLTFEAACDCGLDSLQERINAATAAKEEPK